VGSDRRAVAVEVGGGSSILLGPDNGVLAPAVAFVGGATDAVALDNPEHHLPAAGATFDGRDVFAPVAASLANGVPLHEVGTPIDTATLMPGTMPVAREEHGALVAEVLWVDHFGNVQLNIDADDLEAFGPQLELEALGRRTTASLVGTFADVGTGAIALIVDSYGLIAVVAERASAAEAMAVAAGDEVTVRSAGRSSGGPEVTVKLGQKRGSATSGTAGIHAESNSEEHG
jgi:S-adenosylmethionine hydrolase